MTVKESSAPEVELVVTLPDCLDSDLAALFGARTTLGALTQLVASAEQHIIVGAPFVQAEEGLFGGPLGVALAAALGRGVHVDLVTTAASLANLNLCSVQPSGKRLLRTFQPRTNLEEPRLLGSHAKFLICDREHLYLGSANLTARGISGNFEMGVVLHGSRARQVALLVQKLFDLDYFVETGF